MSMAQVAYANLSETGISCRKEYDKDLLILMQHGKASKDGQGKCWGDCEKFEKLKAELQEMIAQYESGGGNKPKDTQS